MVPHSTCSHVCGLPQGHGLLLLTQAIPYGLIECPSCRRCPQTIPNSPRWGGKPWVLAWLLPHTKSCHFLAIYVLLVFPVICWVSDICLLIDQVVLGWWAHSLSVGCAVASRRVGIVHGLVADCIDLGRPGTFPGASCSAACSAALHVAITTLLTLLAVWMLVTADVWHLLRLMWPLARQLGWLCVIQICRGVRHV